MAWLQNLDLEIKQNKYYDSNYFIKTHNLKSVELKKKNGGADMPISCTIGKIWLIKDNSILEIYSYCDDRGYHSYANFINICRKNKFALQNFNTKNEIYSNNTCDTGNFIAKFIEFGFQLYV